jgi:hypothetical protein
MADLTEYAGTGDIDAPFEVTKQDERRQRQAEEIRDSVTCRTPPLSWEEFAAGAPCPGCGMPYVDAERWESKGTMYFTPEERERYEAEESAYKQRHPSCRSPRHSISGSLTTHCGKCCPPPPLSPKKRRELSDLLGSLKTRPEDLVRWSLRLFCGHTVEQTAHRSYTEASRAFSASLTKCSECGLDPAVVVDARAIGLVKEPTTPHVPSTPPAARPTRAALEQRIRELEAELDAFRATPEE